MRCSTLLLAGLALAGATPAFAQDQTAAAATAGPTAPPAALTFNATATVLTDYRFRGISQTDKNFAVQATVTVTHASGFYVSVFGSSIDSYVTASGQGHQEIDLIGGYKKTIAGTTFDGGILYYFYPKTKLPGTDFHSDFFEPYVDVAHIFGPLTAKVTANYGFKQRALALNQIGPKKDNLYLAGDLSLGIPKTPIGLTAHVGHTFGPSFLATDTFGTKGYTDYNIGASYTYKVLGFGIQYVDTNAHFITPTGKNASGSGVVGSVGVSF